jgi:hypothetical protein
LCKTAQDSQILGKDENAEASFCAEFNSVKGAGLFIKIMRVVTEQDNHGNGHSEQYQTGEDLGRLDLLLSEEVVMMELISDQPGKQDDQEDEFPYVDMVVAGDDEPVEEKLESEDEVKIEDDDVLGFDFFEGNGAH